MRGVPSRVSVLEKKRARERREGGGEVGYRGKVESRRWRRKRRVGKVRQEGNAKVEKTDFETL
jgi:hypothetical protein